MEIRPLGVGEGGRLRELRLRAVRDAPDAFFWPLHVEEQLTPRDWELWAEDGTGSNDRVMFVADRDGEWLAMAGCSLRADDPATMDVTGLWVDPRARGHGIARQLYEARTRWGRQRGAVRVEVAVAETNEAVLSMYRRLGFEPTGQRRPMRSDPDRYGIFLARAL